MLTPKALTQTTHANPDYFTKDSYYIANEDKASEWWGKGALHLQLQGRIDKTMFAALLKGQLPNGQTMGRQKKKVREHRPGCDLTFSAPKSVSLLAIFGEDKRLIEAHHEAVQKTLASIEERHSCYRVTQQGETRFVKGDNLTVGLFQHGLSRENDPQLHTHAVVMNMVFDVNGYARALGSQTDEHRKAMGALGFTEQIYALKKHYGMIYRAHLAYRLRQLGYELKKTHRDGRYEIVGVSSALIHRYSQRREAIEAKMAEHHATSSKAADIATLATRPPKVVMSQEAYAKWLSSHQLEVGKELIPVIESARFNAEEGRIATIENPMELAKDAVRYAMEHLAECEAVFSEVELEATALAYDLGRISPHFIREAIPTLIADGDLVLLPTTQPTELTEYTTKDNLAMEKANIALMQEEKNALAPLVPSTAWLNPILDNAKLTTGQREAALLLLTTPDRVIGIQGYAGTGKTTMLKVVKDLSDALGIVLRGVAPSAAAANQLAQGAGIPSQTLDSFFVEKGRLLKETQKETEPMSEVWLVDESSMGSTRQFHQLLTLCIAHQSRLVLLGDIKQLGAVEAGKPFVQLQKAGMGLAVMQEIVRQKDDVSLKTAIHHTISGDIENAFRVIGKNIVEINDKNERLARMAEQYLAGNQHAQANTLVLTPANNDREIVNQYIRDGLKQQGQLQDTGIHTSILVHERFSLAEKSAAVNYTEGHYVRFNVEQKTLAWVKPQSYYRIETIAEKDNTLVLSAPDNQRIEWKIEPTLAKQRGAMEIYRQETRELVVGERIRWTRNDKPRQLTNMENATVIQCTKEEVVFQLNNGNILRCNPDYLVNQHWEYDYVSTVYSAQGKTADWVIAHADVEYITLNNQKTFYVTISRARYGATLFIDHHKKYEAHLKTTLGEKTSALEFFEKAAAAAATAKDVQPQDTIEPLLPSSTLHDSYKSYLEYVNFCHAPEEDALPASTVTLRRGQPVPGIRQRQPLPSSSRAYYDLYELNEALAMNAESIAKSLLGEPNPRLSNAKQLRFGNKGGVVVTLQGQRRGMWHNFETGESGNLIHLIAKKKELSFAKAIQLAAEWTHTPKATKPITYERVQETPIDFGVPSTEDKAAIDKAKTLWRQGKSIEGTLAERYLTEHRGLLKGEGWGASLRYMSHCWHPIARAPYPALLVKSELAGEIQAVQRIYLDRTTAKKAAIEPVKMTVGRLRFGASAMVQQGKNNRLLCIAEGPETALSVANAMREATVVASLSLSNIKQLACHTRYETILICADNDKGKEAALNLLVPAKKHLSSFANHIAIAIPKAIKTDFNDLLREHGKTAVRECLDEALTKATPAKTTTAMAFGQDPVAQITKTETLANDNILYDQEKKLSTEQITPTPTATLNRLQQVIAARQQQHGREIEH